jgi:hypothetical protein
MTRMQFAVNQPVMHLGRVADQCFSLLKRLQYGGFAFHDIFLLSALQKTFGRLVKPLFLDGIAVRGRSENGDVLCLRAFLPFTDLERDFLTFVKADTLETGSVDLTEMDENVFPAVIGLNETKTFFVIEPFDGSCYLSCHSNSFL